MTDLKSISFGTLYGLIAAKFQALTQREKIIIYVSLVVVAFMGLYQVYEPVRRVFTQQMQQISDLEAVMKNVGPSVERYVKFKARRDSIEEEYKEVEFKEGALSHLETLVRNKAGISTGFTIKDTPPREFGGNYEQTLFSIRFTTTNLQALIDFLQELIHGSRPLIVSKIDIQKSRFADRLEVEVDASSIRRVK